MYSDKKNIQQLTALLLEHGVREVVVCPGSRNAPIVETFSSCRRLRCHAVTDERSAGFYAIGRSLESGCPTAVCCTSGTALLNLHPAVAEAFYQQIPLVVISADRPAAWIGQMDGQTLPQPDVFRGLVRQSVALPEVNSTEEEWYCNRLLNEALLACRHHVCGPVHINIPVSEPLFQFTAETLPEVRVIRRYGLRELPQLAARLNACRKRMVIVGQSSFSRDFFTEAPTGKYEDFLWLGELPANHNAPRKVSSRFDALLYALDADSKEQLCPDLVITFGGHIVSKRLKTFLRNHPTLEHWHISPDGEVADLFRSLTTVIEASPRDAMAALAELSDGSGHDYAPQWLECESRIQPPRLDYSEMSAIGALCAALPQDSVLHLANSSVIRYAQLYDVPASVPVFCNRGTSGIEGSLSTAVGYAAASEKLNFVAIGDLSFFYDMNAIWNDGLSPRLRILLLNNGGGEIFHLLPGLHPSPDGSRFIAAHHRTSAHGWATERGFSYLSARNAAQLDAAMAQFTASEPSDRPVLLEVFTDKEEDARILKNYYHTLKQ